MRLVLDDAGQPRLTGPGAKSFARLVDAHQILMIGEQHYVKGVAELTRVALHQVQRSEQPVHLVLEMGTWVAQRCASLGKAAEQVLREAPHSYTFDANGDLDLLRQAAGSARVEDFVWGVDQMSNAIHPLQRLVALAPDFASRRLARGAALKAALRMGRYSRQDHSADIAALRGAFGSSGPAEVSLILDELAMTQRIYRTWFQGQRGEISKQVSVSLREKHMATLFDRYLARSRVEGKWPRLIFKMGGAHVLWGVGPNGVETLGEHVRRRAQAEQVSICHVGVSAYDPKSGFPPATLVGDGQLTLIDAQAARALLGEAGLAALPAESRMRLERFDHLVYIKGLGRTSDSEIDGYKAEFKRATIFSLLPLAVPLLVLLSGLWPLLAGAWAMLRGRGLPERGEVGRGSAVLCALGLAVPVLILAWQLQQILANRDAVPAAISELWSWVTQVLIWAGWALAGAILLGRRSAGWARAARRHAIVVWLAALVLGLLMLRANLGGMLGG